MKAPRACRRGRSAAPFGHADFPAMRDRTNRKLKLHLIISIEVNVFKHL